MNYERLIIENIPGDTPKQKHDHLIELLKTVDGVVYPRRGTAEWDWGIDDVTEELSKFALQEREYKKPD